MKKLLELKIDSGLKKLDPKNLAKLTGGLEDVMASGNTKTASGSSCTSTAVCNCTCPKEPIKPIKPKVEDFD